MNAQIPWGFKHRPGRPGKYGLSIRFYVGGKWRSRNLGGKFKNASEAIDAGNQEAQRLGFFQDRGGVKA